MLYLHDVWVNWFEGEENGYNVCQFHEWRKSDTIDLLDQIALIHVESTLYNYIENELSELPKQLLDEVYQKSYQRKNHERIRLEYCFLVTDGQGILAVDTIGYNIPMRKSRLIPRQEQLVIEMIKGRSPVIYNFDSKMEKTKEYHILSPNPNYMNGLTRKERQLKQLMFMALDQLKSSKNTAEIRYWFTEWNPTKYKEIQKLEFDQVWEKLFDEVKYGWSTKHEQLCRALVKGQPFFEKLWEHEQTTKVN